MSFTQITSHVNILYENGAQLQSFCFQTWRTPPAINNLERYFVKSLAIPVLGFGLFAPLFAQAHGSMEVPVSRIYNYFKEGPESPKSAACREAVHTGGPQALYDWNGVNQLPNGNHQAFVPDGSCAAVAKSSTRG